MYIYLHLISSVIFGPRFFDARPAVLAEEFLDIGGAPLNPKSLGKRQVFSAGKTSQKWWFHGGWMEISWRDHGFFHGDLRDFHGFWVLIVVMWWSFSRETILVGQRGFAPKEIWKFSEWEIHKNGESIGKIWEYVWFVWSISSKSKTKQCS